MHVRVSIGLFTETRRTQNRTYNNTVCEQKFNKNVLPIPLFDGRA